MSQLAYAVAFLAIAGAVVSWAFGAWYYAQTLGAMSADPEQRGLRLRAVFAWLFVLGRLKGAAAEHSSKVNKAVVAFLACLMIAITAFSVATNLARVAR